MDDFVTAALPSQALVEDEKSPEQKAIEHDQTQDDYHLAALVDHPGWVQIREQMEKDIDDFKTFRSIDMSKYTNTQLGEVVRTERMVADKLQEYLNQIEEAVKAVRSNGNTG